MQPKHILVTGGGGFLGKEICKQLVAKGYQVSSFSRKTYFELEKMGVKSLQGDLCNYRSVAQALKNCFEFVERNINKLIIEELKMVNFVND